MSISTYVRKDLIYANVGIEDISNKEFGMRVYTKLVKITELE
jgi:hypothetical protein